MLPESTCGLCAVAADSPVYVRRGGTGCGGRRKFQIVLGLVALFMILGAGQGFAKKKKPKTPPPPPADLPGHVNYLARQLYGVPLDESTSITGQIQKLVIDHLEAWLGGLKASDAPGDVPLDVKVRRELENAFSKLHYPLFGEPATFSERWKDGTIIGAGYTLGWSDYDRQNVVALFENRDDKTRLAAVTEFVPRTDLHYEFLPAPPTCDFRFIVYGTRLGKSHPRLTAILYSFDGQSLKTSWESRDIYDGKMEVGKDRVIIRYLKEEEYVREQVYKRKPPRHEAVYKITPQGVSLESEREIPF